MKLFLHLKCMSSVDKSSLQFKVYQNIFKDEQHQQIRNVSKQEIYETW